MIFIEPKDRGSNEKYDKKQGNRLLYASQRKEISVLRGPRVERLFEQAVIKYMMIVACNHLE